MGHDITAYTKDNTEIQGPHFPAVINNPLYTYLDAEHHDAGASGDGGSEEITPERLKLAIARLDQELEVWPGLGGLLKPAREFFEQCVSAGAVRIKFW